MPKVSHTPRTIKLLEDSGWTVEKCEQWVEFKRYIKKSELQLLDNLERTANTALMVKAPTAARLPGAITIRIDPRAITRLVTICRELSRSDRGVRRDLFGFGDLIGCRLGAVGSVEVPHIRIFQVTSLKNKGARARKIMDAPEAKAWLDCGGEIELICWHMPKHRYEARRFWIDGSTVTER